MRLASAAVLFLPFAACAAPDSGSREVLAQETPVPAPRSWEDVAPPSRQDELFAELERERAGLGAWRPGEVLAQGFIGVGYPDSLSIDSGGGSVEIDADEIDDLPVIGGGMQLKLAGERVDFGVEGMLSFSFRSDVVAFASGGGGGFVAVDVDVLLFDLFGGPFLSVPVTERARVYAAAGPILRFLEYSQEDELGDDDDSSGLGAGVYARGGIEFRLPSGTLVGFGTRWSSADVDLDGEFGDAELEDFQALITVTRGV